MNFIKIVRYTLNIFDYFQQKKIISFFKKQSFNRLVLFDVGAHHGETVFLFKKNFQINKIYCFEASGENFNKLKKNINNNNLGNICELNNFAIGDVKKNFFLNQTIESSSSTINQLNINSKYFKKKMRILNIKKVKDFYKKTAIEMIKLSDYINNKNIKSIDILKIDTEGYELKVLKGLRPLHKLVKFVYFEHHYDDMVDKKYTFSDINCHLLKYNFKKVYKSKMNFRKSFEYIYKNTNV